jgi:hypothetical protein
MFLYSGNGSKRLSKNEDKTLIEISLFTELIKDESVIDSMIRVLRYERNQKNSAAPYSDQQNIRKNSLLPLS